MNGNNLKIAGIVLAVVVVAVVLLAVFAPGAIKFGGISGISNKGPIPNQFIARPAPPALTGPVEYQILNDPKNETKVLGVKLSQLGGKKGDTQSIKVLVEARTPIDSGVALISGADNIETPIDLKVVSGVTEKFANKYAVNSSGTVFTADVAEYVPASTSTKLYVLSGERNFASDTDSNQRILIRAKEKTIFVAPKTGSLIPKGGTMVEGGRTAFAGINRKVSCNPPTGGDWEIKEECDVAYPDGADDGNAIVRIFGVTIDSVFGLNAGKEFTIRTGGQIALNIATGAIKTGFIWRMENDLTGVKQEISDTGPTGYYRRYLFEDPNKRTGKFNLPAGDQTFSVTESDSVWPKVYQADINPVDVHVGDTQNLGIIVQAEAGQSITSVVAEIETDKDTVKLPLTLQGETAEADIRPNPYYVDAQSQLAVRTPDEMKNIASHSVIPAYSAGIQQTNAASSPKYTYTGSWIVKDTHDTTYHTTFIVTDSSGRANKMTLAWSDACNIPNTGPWLINTYGNCSIAVSDGIESGDLGINGNYTLTLYAGFSINPGYKATFIVGTGSKIAFGSGGSLKMKTYIFGADGDHDGYPASGAMLFSATPTYSGYVRRGVGYDCYDYNANAYPGSGTWSDVNRGDGWYDYNCDGYETLSTTLDAWGTYCVYNYGYYVPNGTGWCNQAGPGNGYPGSCVSPATIPGCGGPGWYINAGYGYCAGDGTLYPGTAYQNCN